LSKKRKENHIRQTLSFFSFAFSRNLQHNQLKQKTMDNLAVFRMEDFRTFKGEIIDEILKAMS
jgi:hypothetical protein